MDIRQLIKNQKHYSPIYELCDDDTIGAILQHCRSIAEQSTDVKTMGIDLATLKQVNLIFAETDNRIRRAIRTDSAKPIPKMVGDLRFVVGQGGLARVSHGDEEYIVDVNPIAALRGEVVLNGQTLKLWLRFISKPFWQYGCSSSK